MLFALTDFAHYLLREGPYSESVFIAQGGFRATPELTLILEQAHDGDGLWCHPTKSFVSWVVMYITGGPWSHVGTLTNKGTILEAITDGVVERPASVYFDGRHYVMIKRLKLDLTDQRRQEMISWMRSRIGAKYNWVGALRLGLKTIFGNVPAYQIRLSIDIVLVLAALWSIAAPRSPIRNVSISFAALYIAVIVANRPVRRRKKAIQQQDDMKPPFFGIGSA